MLRLVSGVSRSNDKLLELDRPGALEKQLKQLPGIVSTAGSLVLLASQVEDFSLEEPLGGFKAIKYNSFRPALVQLTGVITDAFIRVDKVLEVTEIRIGDIPKLVKDVTRYLYSGKQGLIKKFVPSKLQQISDHSKVCAEQASECARILASVNDLLDELVPVIQATKKVFNDQTVNLTRKLEDKMNEQEKIAGIFNRTRDTIAKTEKELVTLENNFKKAYDEIPSSWNVVAQGLVKSVGSLLTVGPKLLEGAMSGITRGVGMAAGSLNAPQMEQAMKEANAGNAQFYAILYLNAASSLSVIVVDTKDKAEKIKNFNTSSENGTVDFPVVTKLNIRKLLGSVLDQIPQENKRKQQIEKQIQDYEEAAEIISRIHSQADIGDGRELKDAINILQSLENQLAALVVAEQHLTGGSGGAAVPAKKPAGGQANADSPEIFKAKEELKVLEEAEKKADQCRKENREARITVAKMAADILRLDAKRMDFEKFLKTIQKATPLLADLKKGFSALSQSFQTIVLQTGEAGLGKIIDAIKNVAETTDTTEPAGQKAMRELLEEQSKKEIGDLTAICSFVITVTKYYRGISRKMVIPQMGSVTKLINTEAKDVKNKASRLNNYREKATSLISKFVAKLREKDRLAREKREAELSAITRKSCNEAKLDEIIKNGTDTANGIVKEMQDEEDAGLQNVFASLAISPG